MAAKSLVLLVLLVLAAAAFSQAAGQCGSGQFQCKAVPGSGCFWAVHRCDGVSDCGDGSDEEGCDALPTVALPANASVTARVQYAKEHGVIELHLCGGQHCSVVSLWGKGHDGTLRYLTYTGCNRLGRGSGCITVKDHTGGIKFFPPGEVVLEVRHRPGQLAVWRQGRPDDVVEVPVEADYATLRVRPWLWGNDMPVQFTDLRAGRWGLSLVTPAPETAPPCGNGGDYRDGACQCPPGFAGPSCETAPSAPLQLAVFRWDRRTVRVRWAAPSSANGVLANYSVLVDGRQQALLAAGSSPCPAWPGLQCLSVPRAGARRLHLAVSASNQWGGHGDRAELAVDLQSGDPDPVEGLEAVAASPSSVLLRWRLPRLLRGDLLFFHVAVEAGSQEAASVEVPEAVTVDVREERAVYEHTLSGLRPGTAYTASVQCNRAAGPGSASVAFATPEDVKDDALDVTGNVLDAAPA